MRKPSCNISGIKVEIALMAGVERFLCRAGVANRF